MTLTREFSQVSSALLSILGPGIIIGWQTEQFYGLALFLFQMQLVILAQLYGRKDP